MSSTGLKNVKPVQSGTAAHLPVIAITSGEPAGVGPELCLRLIEQSFPARIVVLADRELLAARAADLGWPGRLRDWQPQLPAEAGVLDVLHLPLAVPVQPGRLEIGRASCRGRVYI